MLLKRSKKFFTLKIKRASLFCLGLEFFFFSGQNYYLSVQNNFRPNSVRQIEIDLPLPAFYPHNFNKQPPPHLTARGAIVMDKNSAVLIYSKNEKLLLLPASTVKIMTALVALEYFSPEEVLTVGKEINILGQKMKLVEGEKITVRNLLYGLLMASANDAALTLAENYPGGIPAFVVAMNRKAALYNLKNTYFANPTGIDSSEEGIIFSDFSYTTALDLARLASFAFQNSLFSEIIATEKITVTDVSGKISHQLFNINQLLGKVEGLKGGKTGWTEEAAECLVSYVERDNHEIIIVVLGSEDRFGETEKLIDWIFSNHQWINLALSS